MPTYKLTKTYNGGSVAYYIHLDRKEELTDEMLESIGRLTTGGHSSGYRLECEQIERLPKGARLLPRVREERIY